MLEGCAEIAASAPEALTVQLGILVGPDGSPMVMIVPTWCGPPEQGEARVAPFLKLGTVLVSTVAAMSCKDRLGIFAPHIVNGQRVFMETSWLPSIDSRSVDAMIHAMAGAVSPGCAILTHAFTGAASRVPVEDHRLRPPQRSRARRDSCHLRRSIGLPRGAATPAMGTVHAPGLRCDGASGRLPQLPRKG